MTFPMNFHIKKSYTMFRQVRAYAVFMENLSNFHLLQTNIKDITYPLEAVINVQIFTSINFIKNNFVQYFGYWLFTVQSEVEDTHGLRVFSTKTFFKKVLFYLL